MKNRISKRLINHMNELRKRAVKEKDEKLRSDYWWLYFDAPNDDFMTRRTYDLAMGVYDRTLAQPLLGVLSNGLGCRWMTLERQRAIHRGLEAGGGQVAVGATKAQKVGHAAGTIARGCRL